MAETFPLAIVLSTVDKTTAGFDKVSKTLDTVSAKVGKVGKAMTASLTLPIVAVGAAGVKAFADFEAGMSNVATLVDTSTESIDDMGKRVLEISRRTPVALDDLTAALYSTRSAGISAADQFVVLEKSAQLGVAGLSSTAEAVDIVTSSINGFALEGKEADGVYDVLFTAVKHGKTDLAQLGVGFGAVAEKMSFAGIEFDEYIAGVSAMTTVGLPAAQAHTQMRAAIDGLTKSSAPLSKVFKRLGTKDFKTLIQESGGVVPAMMKVREAVGGSEAEMRKLIGSSEGSAAAMSVTGGTYKAFTETLADMRDGVSEFEAGFKKQNETSAAQWTRTKNSLESAAITIGTVLAPALTTVADKVEAAVNWFSELDDETKETIVQIAGVVAVVGPSLIVLGKLASAVSIVTNAVRAMTLAMAANPIAALAIVIGVAAVSIYSNWEDFEDFFALLWDGVKGVFSDAWDFISPIIDKITEGVSTVLTAAADAKAYLTGEATSGDIAAAQARNERIDAEFFARTGTHIPGFGDESAGTAQAQGGQGSVSGSGTSKSHVMIELVGQTNGVRVRSIKSEDMIDVKTGNQGG